MLEKKYKMAQNPPAPISWEEYSNKSYIEYQKLLRDHGDDEAVFQRFFEKNPSFVPGAFELSAPSGHYPFTQSLISEPKLRGVLFDRIPDFIWLAQDSLSFTPVLIEIERPNKKTFTSTGTQTAELSQALGQIAEWKSILGNAVNILTFYDCFRIPERMRKKKFSPQYALIYGRRAEFESDPFLTQKRANLAPEGVKLISFDRLHPDPNAIDLLCTTLSHGVYEVKTIPPFYRYSPMTADNLSVVTGFKDAIPNIEYISDERKKFLQDRYSYWENYGKIESKGIMYNCDHE